MHRNRWRLGLRPRPHWGSLQRSPRPPSWIQGILLLRGGEGRGGKGRGREGKGREGKVCLVLKLSLATPLVWPHQVVSRWVSSFYALPVSATAKLSSLSRRSLPCVCGLACCSSASDIISAKMAREACEWWCRFANCLADISPTTQRRIRFLTTFIWTKLRLIWHKLCAVCMHIGFRRIRGLTVFTTVVKSLRVTSG